MAKKSWEPVVIIAMFVIKIISGSLCLHAITEWSDGLAVTLASISMFVWGATGLIEGVIRNDLH